VSTKPGQLHIAPAPPQLSRKCAACEAEEEKKVPIHAISAGVQPQIYRKVLQAEEMYDSMAPATEEAGPAPPKSEETETLQPDFRGEASVVTPHYQHSLPSGRRTRRRAPAGDDALVHGKPSRPGAVLRPGAQR
jgi:hypothetical protein